VKFKVGTTGLYYTHEEAEKLMSYGFQFGPHTSPGVVGRPLSITQNGEVELESVEELMEMCRRLGDPLILFPDEQSIEIYDDYRE
jgi:hypothetical protein